MGAATSHDDDDDEVLTATTGSVALALGRGGRARSGPAGSHKQTNVTLHVLVAMTRRGRNKASNLLLLLSLLSLLVVIVITISELRRPSSLTTLSS